MELIATERELKILRDWLNQRSFYNYNNNETVRIKFETDTSRLIDNGTTYITDLTRQYKSYRW